MISEDVLKREKKRRDKARNKTLVNEEEKRRKEIKKLLWFSVPRVFPPSTAWKTNWDFLTFPLKSCLRKYGAPSTSV